MKDVSIKELKNAATRMRMNVVDMIYKAQSGHPGGSLRGGLRLRLLLQVHGRGSPEPPLAGP